MAKFNIGDKIEYNYGVHEVVSWPGEGEFFAQLVQHRPDGASSTTTVHVATIPDVKLIEAAPVADYSTPSQPEAPVEPATPVTEPATTEPALTVAE
jgi:hypothetical protein